MIRKPPNYLRFKMVGPIRNSNCGGGGYVKLVSLNIGGNSSTFGGMDRYLVGQDRADILVLQEVKSQEQVMIDLCEARGFSAKVSLDLVSGLGVAVIWRKEFPLISYKTIREGRIQILDLGFGQIVNVYGSAGKLSQQERRKFYGEELFSNLIGFSTFWVIGDFNCVLSPLDTAGNFKDKHCPVLEDLVSTMKLVDGYRFLHPQGSDYTWVRQGFHPSRLDRVIYPAAIKDRVLNVQHKASLSDHKALIVTIVAQDVPPSRKRFQQAYWKLNVNTLHEEDCLQSLEEIIMGSLPSVARFGDTSDWWEVTKKSVCSFLKGYGIRRAKTRRDTTQFLYCLLDVALKDRNFREIQRIKAQLKDLVLEDAWGVAIRSRVTSEIEDEVAGIFHLNQEKKNAEKCSLSKLKIGDRIETDKDTILKEVMDFFTPLFQGKHTSGGKVSDQTFVQDETLLQDFLQGLPKLSPQSRRKLEQPVTLEEYNEMLDKLPTNKSPGLDGLPYEFYRKTKDFTAQPMVDAFNAILDRYYIAISMETGAVRLVPKIKQGIPTVEQLRPITLLNCDYKMLSKILTSRLVSVLGEVLVSGQIIGRRKGDINIVCGAENLIQAVFFAERTRAPFGIFSVDFWKAFDRVFIPYLLQVMRAMGFGRRYRTWIRMLHTNNKSVFIFNGLSPPIEILFSVRQGDPIAMILYVIFLEPLLQKMNRVIQGVWVGGARLLHEPYADDISGLFKEGSLQQIDKLLTDYEGLSGALVNRDKCKAMGLGLWRDRKDFGVKLFKVEESLKILGIWFYPTLTKLVRENWRAVTAKLEDCLKMWKFRVLPTLKLRRMVCEIFGLSKVWYMAQILPLTKVAEKSIMSAVSGFVWTGSHERLDLHTLSNPPTSGGVDLLSLRPKADALFLATWVRLISRPCTSRYWLVSRYWLGWKVRDHLPRLRHNVHGFHHSVIHAKVTSLIKSWVKSSNLQDPENIPKLSQYDFLQQTSKSLYKLIRPLPPRPNIEANVLGFQVGWPVIWKRSTIKAWSPKVQDTMLRVLHNVHPTRERLHHTNHCDDNVCPAEGTKNVRQGPVLPNKRSLTAIFSNGPVQDRTHLFCHCNRVINCWTWVRNVLIWELLPAGLYVMDEEFILLYFPEVERSLEVTWMIGVYIEWIWTQYRRRKGKIPVPEMVAFLQETYRRAVEANLLQDVIPPLR